MMDWTDRYCRYFHRILSKNIWLYTEMVTDQAIVHGNQERLLGFDPIEHPVALQLGGSNPETLGLASKAGKDFGYDEINLNVGCPSDRVQSGMFGLCLMKDPERVSDCMNALAEFSQLPISLKTRTGVDDLDSYDNLQNFIYKIKNQTPCREFIIHARKGWLKGLSPKENREIPPLDYARVYQLKQDFPDCSIQINGGINTLSEIDEHLKHTDGVMIGRAAYHNPYLLAEIEQKYFGTSGRGAINCAPTDWALTDCAPTLDLPTREEIIQKLIPWIEQELSTGRKLHSITRHMLGLYYNQPNAKLFKRNLASEQAWEYLKSIKI